MSLPSTDALTIGYFFSAATAALTKNDMKPSLTPCSFSNRSLYLLRRSMTGCMLTSLNVVRMAAVDCDCTSRSATRWRSRDIGTRCSARPASIDRSTGARTSGSAAFAGVGAAAGCVGGGGALAGACCAASTSPLVMRPSRPVPATWAGLIPASARSFAAAGIATGPAAATAGAAAGLLGAAAPAAGAGAATLALPSVSMVAMVSPDTTVLPSGLTICASTPAEGAGTSSTTLSVSISISTSSRATGSPGFFFHCSNVASATDSDSCGTLTSTIAMRMVFLERVRIERRQARCNARLPHANGSLVEDQAFELGEGGVDQRLLLLVVLDVV